MASPVEQFRLTPLVPIEVGGLDISFTNSAAFMVAGVVVVSSALRFFSAFSPLRRSRKRERECESAR